MEISKERGLNLTAKSEFGEVQGIRIDLGEAEKWVSTESEYYPIISWVYKQSRGLLIIERDRFLESLITSNSPEGIDFRKAISELFGTELLPLGTISKKESEKPSLESILEKLMNFFKEFEFEPNYRFVNTLALKLSVNQKQAIGYVANYFSLIDSTYQTEIASKCRSKEFRAILDGLKDAKPTNQVNKRLAIYYGSAGTGKTTQAMEESEGRCVVCNSSMLPSDLMEDFVFEEGKPTFQKSSLWNCMEQGKPIVLDEINLLPFDSLRFLQGILDGKKEIDYKGNKILIQDGFKVIGTMNLSIGGIVYGLPEPLVDRCAEIKQFSLTAKQLLNALM